MMQGFDISKHQKSMNDAGVLKNYGDFVIIRTGFTGWGTGVSKNDDECFERFYKQCKAAGLYVGAYWFSCANTAQKGLEEAKYMYEHHLKGKQFEFPIYIDVEDKHHQVNKQRGVTDAIKAFCDFLEAKGYYVGIYASDIFGFKEKMYLNELDAYDKWVARYDCKPTYVKDYGIHQVTSKKRITEYGGNLDFNDCFKDYPNIIKKAGFNGFTKGSVEISPEKAHMDKIKEFLPNRGYFKYGDKSAEIGKISAFMYKTFPAYTEKKALGDSFGPFLLKSVKGFQKRAKDKYGRKLVIDGNIGPLTLDALINYGFKI